MPDVRALLSELRRPRLLIRAARLGLQDYRRDRDLRRLLPPAVPLTPEAAVPELLSEEARLEATRRLGGAQYSTSRHIALLIALLAEARLLPHHPAH
jgi:hypothetical protein